MKQQPDVYLFGQVLGTHSFLLKDGFLQPDEYAEIREQYFLPGGETDTILNCLQPLTSAMKSAAQTAEKKPNRNGEENLCLQKK